MSELTEKVQAKTKEFANNCIRFALIVSLLFTFYSTTAQKDYQFLYRIQGVDLGSSQMYDFEGTSIKVHTYKAPIAADILKDAKKQNGLKNKVAPMELSGFEKYPYIYSQSKELEADIQKVTTVFIYEKDSTASYIAFHGWSFDSTLYRQFLSAHANRMLTGGIYISPASADSIDFLGRILMLGPACQWMGPRSVQCKRKGQINWSIHSSLLRANEAAQFQYYYTDYAYPMKAISEEEVSIAFEGVAAVAKRVTWKVSGIKGFFAREMEGSNKLVAYYISAEIDGQFVHCVLSHWDNDPVLESSSLPPLLSEVMTIEKK